MRKRFNNHGVPRLGDYSNSTSSPRAIRRYRFRVRKRAVTISPTCYTDGSGLDDKAAGAYTRSCHLGFHEAESGSELFGIKATHYGGELNALEGAREVCMLAMLTDSKPAISAMRKLDKGLAPPLRHWHGSWRNSAREGQRY